MASAVSLATKICASIKSIGYRGQIGIIYFPPFLFNGTNSYFLSFRSGYHQLLYASPVENRRLLSWLITQLPSNESEDAVLGSETSVDLSKEVLSCVNSELKVPLQFLLPTSTSHQPLTTHLSPFISPFSFF